MSVVDKSQRRPVVIVVGALAPYTHILYERLASRLDRPLHVLACSLRETARQWDLETNKSYGFEVLSGLRWHRSAITNHYLNVSVMWRLRSLRPAVVVVNDFSLTMLMAATSARLLGIPYGVRTDGLPDLDPGSGSSLHRMMRRALVPHAAFGLGPSVGSKALLDGYGLRGPYALAPLFPAWQSTRDNPTEGRAFDVMFCGSLNEEKKGARFFTDVVLGCAARGRILKVRVVGTGPLRDEMEARFAQAGVTAHFDGFLQQADLEQAYRSARLFHFPTRGDVWGIVAQEALQAGTPVFASLMSGVASELIGPGECGAILPLDQQTWIDETLAVLGDPARQVRMKNAGYVALRSYTPEKAVDAYADMLNSFLKPHKTFRSSANSNRPDAA